MADALSRKLHHVYEISSSQAEFNVTNQIKEATQKDPKYAYLASKLRMYKTLESKVNTRLILKIY